MGIALIGGLIAGASSAIVTGVFSWAAFAIAAGMSLVTRALTPKPDLGTKMGGRAVMTREAAHSRKIIYGRARIGGNVVYLESTGSDNKYLWLVTAIAGHEIDGYEKVYFNDEKIWDSGSYVGTWASYVSIYFYTGDQTSANQQLIDASNNKWTTNHKLLDTAYMVVKLTYDQEKFAQGLPNISTVIRGKKVFNPVNSSPVWSQNPALCLYDYLRDTKYGLGESTNNILYSSVSAALGVCNETVTLANGSTQVRYTIDGVIDTADSLKSNIELMVGSMAGRLIYSSGKFEIHAGRYVAPSFTVDESHVVGEITVQTKQTRRNGYNAVKGVFLSEQDNYVLADYPAQLSKTTAGDFVSGQTYKILTVGTTNFTAIGASANTVGINFTATGAGSGSGTASLFLAEDDEQIFLDMPLPLTVNNVRAQRLARMALLRSRQQETITLPCNLSALKFTIGDNINVTNARLGYNQKIFEVVGYSVGFSGDGKITVNVEAIETASSVWDWTSSDEEVFLGGGEVDIYDGTTAQAPASITVTGDSFVATDGTFSTSFLVNWPNSDDAFIDHYVVEHKLTTASEYVSQQTKISPSTIIGLQDGQQYNVRVKAVNGIGVSSSYVSATPTAAVDTTAPSLPTSITATAGYKSISLAWTNPSQKDFNNVEIYRSTSSSGTYAEVSNVAGGFGAKAEHLDGGLADATAFYYKFKSVDKSGNKSAFSSVVNATTNAEAINGSDGKSTFTAPIFKRASSAPSAPSGGSFNFGTNALTPPSGWSTTVPSGTDPIYQANFQFSITGDTGSQTAGTWSTPVVIAENGTDGTDGLSTFTFAVHKRASSAPSTPSGGSYNFGTNTITAPSGWSETIPSGTDPIYISSTRAQISGATGTDSSLSWTAPIVFAINGENGGDGVNTAPVYAYKRSSSTLGSTDKPTTTRTWTFENASFGNNDLGNSWTGEVPSGTDDLYICAAVASSTGATDSVVATDWSAPQALGTNGENGTNGVNTAVVYGYKRSSSTVTDKPSTTRTWTFSSGDFDNNDLGNSFTGVIPSGTDNLYVCSAVASSTSSTDSVTGTSDWSAPQLLASNGIDGDPGAAGVRNASGYVYYSLSVTGNTGPSAPTATAYNFTTGAFTNLNASGGDSGTWSRTPPINTGGDAKYWATSYYVTEATYNGTQTITFGTVFNSVTFDGLVTFTNLNTALSTEGGNVTTIDGGLIETDSITVNKLSGDVSEVYPIGQRYYTDLTSSAVVMGSFSLPAPTNGIAKRNKVDLSVQFRVENAGQTGANTGAFIRLEVQKKSKGQNATEVTTSSVKVVVEPESIPYQQIISIAGNQLEKIDLAGGVAANDDASGTYEPASMYALYYDAISNKTFMQISAYQNVFSTGDDLYYSEDKFASSGTWVSPSIAEDFNVHTPEDYGSGTAYQSFYIPFKMSYGQTTTASNYRVTCLVNNAQSNVVYEIRRAIGTLENIS